MGGGKENLVIDVKDAASTAGEFLRHVRDGELYNLEIEEVEIDEKEEYWYVTLGFGTNPFSSGRQFKVFKIDAESGRVVSMKMRSAK